MNVTEEINAVVAANNGNIRDALNVTLAKLQLAKSILEKISTFKNCSGEPCFYCDTDQEHPLSTEAHYARMALETL